ncbi:nucleotidyltransferase family protein [Niabella insulamsoli]|uniref:nucleotidyltransferase family protein n=1 Tax=Niabella insulamsoli TaxID=3144874 RepID=UPI0031FC9465
MAKVQALLLAAGASKRMGRPKQLLPWGDQSLITHQISRLQQANLEVTVVLGAQATMIAKEVESYKVKITFNAGWEQGMGSSIAWGADNIDTTNLQGLLITLTDQPWIEAGHYKKMIDAFRPGQRQIIVSQSKEGVCGVPVLFDRCHLPDLRNLKGHSGAKGIIAAHPTKIIVVSCENSMEDIDTPESYRQLLETFKKQVVR